MRKILVGLILSLLVALPVFAASSRYVVEIEGKGIVDIDGIEVKVKIYNEDSKISASANEDVDFKIRNGRDGDKCDQQTDKTNAGGNIQATCYASKTGSYSVYVKSNDRGDESADFVLTFEDKPAPTPTLSPTKKPTPTPEPTIKEDEESDFAKATSEEKPTPTPEPEVAGFFSKPGNMVATIVGVLALAGLVFLLFKNKIIDLSKFKKKGAELKEIKPESDQNNSLEEVLGPKPESINPESDEKN